MNIKQLTFFSFNYSYLGLAKIGFPKTKKLLKPLPSYTVFLYNSVYLLKIIANCTMIINILDICFIVMTTYYCLDHKIPPEPHLLHTVIYIYNISLYFSVNGYRCSTATNASTMIT